MLTVLCRDSQHVGLKSLHCNLQVRHSLYVPFQTLMCICITLMVGPQRKTKFGGTSRGGGRRVKMQRRSRMRRVMRREGGKKKEGRRAEEKSAGQTRTEGCREEEKNCHFSPCQRSHRRIQVKKPNQTNWNPETDSETSEECGAVHN